MYVAWTKKLLACLCVPHKMLERGGGIFPSRGRKERRRFIFLYRYRVTSVFGERGEGGRGWCWEGEASRDFSRRCGVMMTAV
ncbi:unnamed protein product [Ectocarpus sp. 6 AP-2014]